MARFLWPVGDHINVVPQPVCMLLNYCEVHIGEMLVGWEGLNSQCCILHVHLCVLQMFGKTLLGIE